MARLHVTFPTRKMIMEMLCGIAGTNCRWITRTLGFIHRYAERHARDCYCVRFRRGTVIAPHSRRGYIPGWNNLDGSGNHNAGRDDRAPTKTNQCHPATGDFSNIHHKPSRLHLAGAPQQKFVSCNLSLKDCTRPTGRPGEIHLSRKLSHLSFS